MARWGAAPRRGPGPRGATLPCAKAAGLERFALFGISEGGLTAIAYAARHPERVSHLILYGTFLEGGGASESFRRRWDALITLAREGWGRDQPTFRHMFTTLFLPDGTPEQIAFFNRIQKESASPETAARVMATNLGLDVRSEAERIDVPTLVMHPRGDRVIPFAAGRAVAASIPGAEFLPLEGENHYAMADPKLGPRLVEAIEAFLDATPPAASAPE